MRDVVVIGAGAAGLAAAQFAAAAGADVLLVEGAARVGTKILASGGGRCNVLPSRVDGASFWSHSAPRTMQRVLAAFPLDAARAWFERDLGVALVTEVTGKVFPRSNRAADIVHALRGGCDRAGVELRTSWRVDALTPVEGGFEVVRSTGEVVGCRRVVLASGGLALPKSGSDGFGLRAAEALGHSVAATYPALVPLTIDAPDLRALSGIAVPVSLSVLADGRVVATEPGDLLLTHRGLSGPATLQISRHLTEPDARGRKLRIAWSAADWRAELADGAGGRQLGKTLRNHLPTRLADALVARSGMAAADRIAGLRKPDRLALEALLGAFEPIVTGSEGYKTAEVTGGGVRLDEVAAHDLQSRVVPGLHLCGEVLDATGRLGGYNFLWAWASGKVAGLGAAAARQR